jgi:hypothetical protein
MTDELAELLRVDMDLKHQFEQRIFPFKNCCVPQCFECDMCDDPGWGPMLKDEVWIKIQAKERKLSIGDGFLCEPCMVKRLGRPLVAADLAPVPMNALHPLFNPSP